jgi:hypothetical protein
VSGWREVELQSIGPERALEVVAVVEIYQMAIRQYQGWRRDAAREKMRCMGPAIYTGRDRYGLQPSLTGKALKDCCSIPSKIYSTRHLQ